MYELIYKVLLFLHPVEILKKTIKIILVSKEIFFYRISYYPKSVIAFEKNLILSLLLLLALLSEPTVPSPSQGTSWNRFPQYRTLL